MSCINDNPIFQKCRSSLKETSKDTSSGNDEYMVQSSMEVIDFDKVKDEFVELNNIKEAMKSMDALFVSESSNYSTCDAKFFFIEFKSGDTKNVKKRDISDKMRDSLILFSHITNLSVKEICAKSTSIFVYDKQKNPDLTSPDSMEESESLDELAHGLSNNAKEVFVKFGIEIDKYQNFLFKDIFTYTIEDFTDKFISIYG